MSLFEAAKGALEEKEYRKAVSWAHCFAMKEGVRLSSAERNLFLEVYDARLQHETGILDTITKSDNGEAHEEQIKEIVKVYRMVLQVLDDFLIDDAKSVEELVFYWKMDGDYHWDMSKFLNDGSKDKKSALANCKQSYEAAMRWTEEKTQWFPGKEEVKLGRHDPIRLQLACRFSNYCFCELQDSERAIEIATTAIDEFEREEQPNLPESAAAENAKNLELLRDLISTWRE